MLHPTAGNGAPPPHPGRLPALTLLIVGVVQFGFAYVLLALMPSGTVPAAVVASAFVVGLGLVVRHLGDVLRGELD